MTFGQKLKKLRTDNMLTQEQLADKLFVTRTAVSKWETDRGFPSIDSLKAVADLFNVRIDDLVSEDDIENKKLADEKRAPNVLYSRGVSGADYGVHACGIFFRAEVFRDRKRRGANGIRRFRVAFQT